LAVAQFRLRLRQLSPTDLEFDLPAATCGRQIRCSS
jgi:hypothetical protein